MASSILGLHHVTAIAGHPQQTMDFYTKVLGLRLVKVTVDVHDPESYHLIFGTGAGEPGTLLSFLCWPGAIQGRSGTGQVRSTGMDVPPGSLAYWRDRLTSKNVAVVGPSQRDGFQSLSFRDRDGLLLDLVVADAVVPPEGTGHRLGTQPADAGTPDTGPRPIPVDRAIRGLHGITISAGSGVDWDWFLTMVLGLNAVAEDASGRSYAVPGGNLGAHVIVRAMPYVGRGMTTVGYVHHAAFRVPDQELNRWRSRVAEYTDTLGHIDDHVYYQSLHLEGPEGVRLELASDGPGVTIDETLAELGRRLVLPPWLEPRRADLERQLRPLRLPSSAC